MTPDALSRTTPSAPASVAVLGLGAMGHAVAINALRAGLPTVVWNHSPERTRDLAALGAHVVDTAVEAAQRADIVVTMVTDRSSNPDTPSGRSVTHTRAATA